MEYVYNFEAGADIKQMKPECFATTLKNLAAHRANEALTRLLVSDAAGNLSPEGVQLKEPDIAGSSNASGPFPSVPFARPSSCICHAMTASQR